MEEPTTGTFTEQENTAEASHRGFEDAADTRIAKTRSEAEAAAANFEREKNALYTGSGNPIYAASLHNEMLDAATKKRDEAFVRLTGEIEELTGDVNHALEVSSQPPRLSDEENERAMRRKDFVREDMDHTPLTEIPDLLRAAELSGDRVEAWCAARYAQMRVERELERVREVEGDSGEDIEGARAIDTIRERVQKLKDGLRLPGDLRRRETLQRLNTDTQSVASLVLNRSMTDEERLDMSASVF